MLAKVMYNFCLFHSNHPSVFDVLPSPFNSTLTLTLLPYDSSLTYQLGIGITVGLARIRSVSISFEKPCKNIVLC